MALKDWKLDKEGGRGHIIYYSPPGQNLHILKELGANIYDVYINVGFSLGNPNKVFKSKTEALKFAKQYMKTH